MNKQGIIYGIKYYQTYSVHIWYYVLTAVGTLQYLVPGTQFTNCHGGPFARVLHQLVCEQFRCVGFLVVFFLDKSPSQPTKNYLLWETKSGPNATFDFIFLGLGWPLGWGVRRFHNNIFMFQIFQPKRLGNSKHPIHSSWRVRSSEDLYLYRSVTPLDAVYQVVPHTVPDTLRLFRWSVLKPKTDETGRFIPSDRSERQNEAQETGWGSFSVFGLVLRARFNEEHESNSNFWIGLNWIWIWSIKNEEPRRHSHFEACENSIQSNSQKKIPKTLILDWI